MNLRPSGYEPDELPGCSTPRHCVLVRRPNTVEVMRIPGPAYSRFEPVIFFPTKAGRFGGGLILFGSSCFFGDYASPFIMRLISFAFCRPGSDLLSRALRQSTIGAGAFHGRVRNGNGCGHPARTTRSAKRKANHEKLARSRAYSSSGTPIFI